MNKRMVRENAIGRFVSMDELRQYTGLGRDSAMKIGRDSGAVIKIGRRVVYDLKKIDEYLESLAE